jgi:hypothetical protein
MNGTLFIETLPRSWRGTLYWGIAVGLYGFFISNFIQDAAVLKKYAQVAKSFPPQLLQRFGGGLIPQQRGSGGCVRDG